MIVVFGTRFCGKVAAQWVESKFFSVMFIPIFPVGSMFVTNADFRRRQGFTMAVNAQSVKAVYGRMFSLIFSVWFLFLAADNYGSYEQYPLKNNYLSAACSFIRRVMCVFLFILW